MCCTTQNTYRKASRAPKMSKRCLRTAAKVETSATSAWTVNADERFPTTVYHRVGIRFRTTEFVLLVSAEANEICEKEAKKTILPEHVIGALKVKIHVLEGRGLSSHQPPCSHSATSLMSASCKRLLLNRSSKARYAVHVLPIGAHLTLLFRTSPLEKAQTSLPRLV